MREIVGFPELFDSFVECAGKADNASDSSADNCTQIMFINLQGTSAGEGQDRVLCLAEEIEVDIFVCHLERDFSGEGVKADITEKADTVVSGNSVGALGSADSKQAKNWMTEVVNVTFGESAKVIGYGNVGISAQSNQTNMSAYTKANTGGLFAKGALGAESTLDKEVILSAASDAEIRSRYGNLSVIAEGILGLRTAAPRDWRALAEQMPQPTSRTVLSSPSGKHSFMQSLAP